MVGWPRIGALRVRVLAWFWEMFKQRLQGEERQVGQQARALKLIHKCNLLLTSAQVLKARPEIFHVCNFLLGCRLGRGRLLARNPRSPLPPFPLPPQPSGGPLLCAFATLWRPNGLHPQALQAKDLWWEGLWGRLSLSILGPRRTLQKTSNIWEQQKIPTFQKDESSCMMFFSHRPFLPSCFRLFFGHAEPLSSETRENRELVPGLNLLDSSLIGLGLSQEPQSEEKGKRSFISGVAWARPKVQQDEEKGKSMGTSTCNRSHGKLFLGQLFG